MSWLKNRQPKLWRERQYDPLTEEGINVSINVVQGRDPAALKINLDLTEPQMRFAYSTAKYPAMVGGLGSGKNKAGIIRLLLR